MNLQPDMALLFSTRRGERSRKKIFIVKEILNMRFLYRGPSALTANAMITIGKMYQKKCEAFELEYSLN